MSSFSKNLREKVMLRVVYYPQNGNSGVYSIGMLCFLKEVMCVYV